MALGDMETELSLATICQGSLDWYKDEVATVIAAYNSGMGIVEMADTFKREQEEVAVLLMDLAVKDKIRAKVMTR